MPGALHLKIEGYLYDWEEEFGISSGVDTNLGSRFNRILQAAAEQTGRGAVVLVDEYDKPLLDVLEKDPELLEQNREILKAFYSVFKLADASLRFVFLTGVTKFSQVSVFSGFNQPKDISMFDKYEALCGITEEELHTQFAEPIREMAAWEGCTEEEMRQRLKRHYDGYHFSKEMTDIYNPFSVLNAFDSQDIRDFWFASGTPTYLIRLMNHFHEGIDQLSGMYYSQDEFVNYKADTEYPLPMIYQSGYLTIKKDYDKRRKTFLLDFPNNEVKNGFLTLVASDLSEDKENVSNLAQDLAFALEDGKLDNFRQMLTSFLASIPYTMRRKESEPEKEPTPIHLLPAASADECVHSLLKGRSEGRVMASWKHRSACISLNSSWMAGSEALKQIEAKGYAREYEAGARQVVKVGVSFSSQTGTIEEWEVRK